MSPSWAKAAVQLAQAQMADPSTPLGQAQAAALKASTEGPTDGSAYRAVQAAMQHDLELRFIESNVIGRYVPTEADVEEALAAVETAAAGIRSRRFEATPSRNACRWCAYRQICPFTATRE